METNREYHLILMSYWRVASDWLVDYLRQNNVQGIAYVINAEKRQLLENTNFVFNDLEYLKNAGFKIEAIDLDEVKDIGLKLANVDLIYVRGGNTFDLLDSVRKSGFDQLLPDLLARGVIYAGSSAGSILPGPNIEIAENNFAPDSNNIGLVNTSSLNLVDFAIFPHWEEKWRNNLNALISSKNITYEVKTLKDNQIILVKNGNAGTIEL